MNPLEEARKDVSRTLKNIIRVEVINRFQDQNIGLESIDDRLDQEAEEAYKRIIENIESVFENTSDQSDIKEDGYKQSHYYYSAFTIAIVGYMIGFNAIR